MTFENFFFRYATGISVLVLLLTAGLYAYLGTFSRYAGDDYCEAARVSTSSPVAAVFDRYFGEDWPRATMRYSNLLFVGFSESLGRYSMQITIPVMVLLWFAGNIWGVYELRRFLRIDWSFLVDLFLGLTFAFFSFRQAPNLFETVYWRSAMMTHFAPLVFGLFLLSFLIRLARRSESAPPSLFLHLFIIAVTFIIAGFSEPPTTTMLTAIPLLMVAVWFWGDSPVKQKYLALLTSLFIGAILGLLAMLLSPASVNAAQEKPLNIIELLMDSFVYSYQFIVDSLRTQPLPIFLSMLISVILLWGYGQSRASALSKGQKRAIRVVMMAVPFLAWLFIAAGFAPSAYGQSFPVERARFLARAVLIAAVMLEGALLGLLLSQIQLRSNPAMTQSLVALVFTGAAIGYPLRTAASLVRVDLPVYSARAEQWDARDASIRARKDEGIRDVVVPFLSGEIIQDLGDHKGFRLNRCASTLYGVDSILALPREVE